MSETWSVPGWAVLSTLAALALVALVLALVLVRSRASTRAALADARTDVAALQSQVEAIEQRLARPTGTSRTAGAPAPEFVITRLGDDAPEDGPAATTEPAAPPAARVPGPLFADLVLREGVVQTAALAAGVRRALAPEARHKIRLEMRREVKRSRKQRKADQREARRDWESRQRAAGDAA